MLNYRAKFTLKYPLSYEILINNKLVINFVKNNNKVYSQKKRIFISSLKFEKHKYKKEVFLKLGVGSLSIPVVHMSVQ